MKAFYLDIGNTSLRLAEFAGNEWVVLWHQRYGREFTEFMQFLMAKAGENPFEVYISSVRKDITKKLQKAAPTISFRILSTREIPGNLLNYSTVQTLGMDRFLGCLGAYQENRKSIIVIDTGSACTIDFMDDAGVYQGGVIMPGIEILKKSMRRYLPELPVVQPNIPERWPGKSTQESLQWGVNGLFKAAIESWIHKYKTLDSNADIFITGGNSEEVKKLLMPDLDIIHQQELHFKGMKYFVEEIVNSQNNSS